MARTYTNGSAVVVIEKGRITDETTSDYFRSGPDFQVSSKIDAATLGRFGYRPKKKPVQKDVWGRTIN